ncbi:UNVERIFIED_CONTAM: hypothetical protein NCL1_53918 [Trichonephila clavipes]
MACWPGGDGKAEHCARLFATIAPPWRPSGREVYAEVPHGYHRNHQRADRQQHRSAVHERLAQRPAVWLLRPCCPGRDGLRREVRLRRHPAESGNPREPAEVRQLADVPAAVGRWRAGRRQRHPHRDVREGRAADPDQGCRGQSRRLIAAPADKKEPASAGSLLFGVRQASLLLHPLPAKLDELACGRAVDGLLAGDRFHVAQADAVVLRHLLVFGAARLVDQAGDLIGLAAGLDHAQVAVGLLAQLAAGLGVTQGAHRLVQGQGIGRQTQGQRQQQGRKVSDHHASP